MLRLIKRIAKRLILFFKLDYLFILLFGAFNNERLKDEGENLKRTLEGYSPDPNGTCFTANEIEEKYDCHVIIPAYNVEKYIKECIDSVINQETNYSYKVTIINDGSTDKTGEILKSYENHDNVEIITQENKGFSGARNTGLKKICGKYVCFVDSDDILPKNSIETLINYAEKENAEIVQGGYYRLENGVKVKGIVGKYSLGPSSNNKLTGFAWGKVFRNYIFKDLKYPEKYWFEDSLFSFLIYPRDYKSLVIPDIVYYYRDNFAGISRSATKYPKCLDTYYITEMMLKEHGVLGFEVNEAFHDKMMRQYIINYKRLNKTPIEIQKAVFLLTCKLHEQTFPKDVIKKKYKRLDKAIRQRNFGYFNFYCKYKIY